MEILLELQKLLLDQFKTGDFYYRNCFESINFDNSVTGIIGSRGTGKTTFLLHTILNYNQKKMTSLYVSADHVYFLENTLLNLVDTLYKTTDIRLLCIDEIHKYQNWEQELKNIADFYLDFKIVFSGSSMIDIIHSKFDLSRRVTLYRLNGFSFREYLEFTQKIKLASLSLSQILNEHTTIIDKLPLNQPLKHFKNYLKTGYFPFLNNFSDNFQMLQAIENIIQKTIYEDIATLHSIKTPTLLTIEKLYKYITHSQPGELSAYKLANTLSKDYENITSYLLYLQQAGLIRALYKKQTGKAYLRNPIKMYPDNTNLIYAAYLAQPEDMLLGKVRETFAINQLQNSGLSVFYSEHGDFKIDDNVFEIGGKNKTTKQIKDQKNAYIFADDILIGTKNKIPLFMLGLLS
ncbi:MAG: ATPase [Legionellaceae bacterium]|nr:ATPase [Legionellaceae bacterium]